jgi:hypothetical protein
MNKRYVVRLDADERRRLQQMVHLDPVRASVNAATDAIFAAAKPKKETKAAATTQTPAKGRTKGK